MKQLSAMPLQNFLPVKALQFAHLFREYSHPVGHLLNFPLIKEVINNICIYIMANTVHIQCVCLTGCWLGNPLGAPGSKDRVWVTCCVTQDEVTTATNSTTTEKALALRLMKIFFTEDKLAEGNCTPAAGRQVLDANILAGIRGKSHQFTVYAHCITILLLLLAHINWKYPSAEEEKRWHQLIVGPMNSRCRTARAKRSTL